MSNSLQTWKTATLLLGLVIHLNLEGSSLTQQEPLTANTANITVQRADELRYLVRQDCGSCHGMLLKGGLGPALLPENLTGQNIESMMVTILYGRPTTPMPPWKGILSEEDTRWIAEQLKAGAIVENRE